MSELTYEALLAENKRLRVRLENQQSSSFGVDDKLQKLLEIMPAGVVIINSLGIVGLCNPAARSLLCGSLVGSMWRDVVKRCFAPQADDGHEVSLKDGRRVSIATRALVDNQGQLIVLTNLTETRRLQGRLAHLQRLGEMGKMMASLAHQIRTPLSAALLYVGHLAKPELSTENQLKFSSKAKARLLNIEQQISDMLIFARGDGILNDRITLQELFSSIDDALDVPLVQYDADCDLLLNAGDTEFMCNKDVLVGAIINVVINALQAAKGNINLKIESQLLGRWLVVSVIDNGPGMDSVTLLKVQEPFYTTKSHGTGLGLSVAKEVAKSHGGRFEIASQLGKGTVAGFWLPVITS